MRIVIKIGTNVITKPNGKLDITRISGIVDQIAHLMQKGKHEVILVSSGAVAAGRFTVSVNGKTEHEDNEVINRQILSSIGQIKLMGLYTELFQNYNIACGQILTIGDLLKSRHYYRAHHQCIEAMMSSKMLPIVNENDTLSLIGLMFTDNDDLAATMATMVSAEQLIILSSIDGVYSGSPDDPNAKLLEKVAFSDDLSKYITGETTTYGKGGMHTKIKAARKAAREGVTVTIANGRTPRVLELLVNSPEKVSHTTFETDQKHSSAVQTWMEQASNFAKSTICINDGAVKALTGDKPASVLLVGVSAIKGDFTKNDVVKIIDEQGKLIAYGKSNYNSDEARLLVGERDHKPLVHYNYLSLADSKP